MISKLRTASGRSFRSESLIQQPVPIAADATANRGAIALGSDGRIYFSVLSGGNWVWALAFSSAANGEFLLGVPNPITLTSTNTSAIRTPFMQLAGESSDRSMQMVYAAGSHTPTIGMVKAAGTLAAPTAPPSGAGLAGFNAYAYDGASYGIAARILAICATAATGSTAASWHFETTPPGAITPTLRMRVTQDGQVQIGAYASTERFSVDGNMQLVSTTNSLMCGANAVVGSRKTGWAAATGTATRTTFATSTVTLPQLAERVKALLDDLTLHGLIGT